MVAFNLLDNAQPLQSQNQLQMILLGLHKNGPIHSQALDGSR